MSDVRNDAQRDPHDARRFPQCVPAESSRAVFDCRIAGCDINRTALAIGRVEGNKIEATSSRTVAVRVGFCLRDVGPVDFQTSLVIENRNEILHKVRRA